MTYGTFGICAIEPIRKNRARTLNEILAEQDYDFDKGTAIQLPTQTEIDEMVRKALAKIRPIAKVASAPRPELMPSDPVESAIRKAEHGATHPAEIDALTDEYVRKAMTAEDRGSVPAAYERLAKGGDKGLGRLYSARQLVAVTFRKEAVSSVSDRDAALAEAARIEGEIDRKAADLRTAHPGRFTPEQAKAVVLEADKKIYSDWIAAKEKAKR